jgi:hypothetical protein
MQILREIFKDFWSEIVISFFSEIQNAYRDVIRDMALLEYQVRHTRFFQRNAKVMFGILNLKPIPIRVPRKYNNCSYSESTIGLAPSLDFGCAFLKDTDYWSSIFDYLPSEFKTREDKLLFVLAHEMAHYLQYSKYPKWVAFKDHRNDRNIKRYVPENKDWWTAKEYRQLPMEKNADRIALIICKKMGICP